MRIRNQALFLATALVMTPPMLLAQDSTPEVAVISELTADQSEHYIALGNRVAGLFFNGQTDSLLAHFHPSMMIEMGGRPGLEAQMIQTEEQLGLPVEVLVSKVGLRDGTVEFWWEANFSNFTAEPFVLRIQFDENDLITFGTMNPKSEAPTLP